MSKFKLQSLFLVFFVFFSINFVSAHEKQVLKIGGIDYMFVVGSLNESIVVGDKTGIDLKISLADKNDLSTTTSKAIVPVLNLEKDLKIENISGDIKKEFDLTSAWGKPGNYNSTFYPTNSDIFSYRIIGKINNTDVDLLFTCNKNGHDMSKMADPNVHENMKMQNGGFEVKHHSGAFGCPKEKEQFLFPNTFGDKFDEKITNKLFFFLSNVLVFLLGYFSVRGFRE